MVDPKSFKGENKDQQELYDYIYAKDPTYNSLIAQKLPYVENFAKRAGKTFIDAGCGRGNYLKRLVSLGYNVLGVEFSKVCCEKYLKDYQHVNADILDFCESTDKRFDGVICSDVFEHLNPEDLNNYLLHLSKLSRCALFGVANHPDVVQGIEMHVIFEDENWWLNKFKEFYEAVKFIVKINKWFYLFECANPKLVPLNKVRLDELLTIKRMSTNSELEGNKLRGLHEMIHDFFKPHFRMVEIGCFEGSSTELFLLYCAKVFAIDPFYHRTDNYFQILSKSVLTNAEKTFLDRMKNYKNVEVFRDFSLNVVDRFKDASLDAVYIDGDHSYEAVKNDLIHWLPKVKSGGYICGHDLTHGPVRKAIYEVLSEPLKTYKDMSWIVRKV